jgi:hypothetical protein
LPPGTRCDQQEAFFIGGSPELADPSTAARPRASEGADPGAVLARPADRPADGGRGMPLNRYGFKTVSSGEVKVRLHCMHQLGADHGDDDAAAAGGRDASPQRAAAAAQWVNGGGGNAAARAKKELSLAVVLERARARLEDARAGGGEVAVRAGAAAAAAPFVRRQPADAAVDEGATVQFSVAAGVSW